MPDWLTFPVVKDVLLALLALYGAALSTFNYCQSVRKERRTIEVNLSSVAPTYDDGNVGQCFAKVEATNAGHRAVTVRSLRLELATGAHLISLSDGIPGMPDTPLPATLADGQSAHKLLSYQGIAAALVQTGRTKKTKVTPVCEDSVGGIYKGKPWEVDPAEFSRL